MPDEGDKEDLESVIKELKSVKKTLNEYTTESRKTSKYRRIENIQLLVSLAVIGGSITLYVQNKIPNTYELAVLFITIASAGFVVIKTVIPPIRINKDSKWLRVLDFKIAIGLYGTSVILTVLTALYIVITKTNIFSIRSPTSDEITILTYIGTAASALLSIVLVYVYWTSYAQMYEDLKVHRVSDYYREEDIRAWAIQQEELLYPYVAEIDKVETTAGTVRVDAIGKNEKGVPVLIEFHNGLASYPEVGLLDMAISQYSNEHGKQPKGLIVAPQVQKTAVEHTMNSDRINFIEVMDELPLPEE